MISKQFLNAIRGVLRKEIKEAEPVYKINKNNFENAEKGLRFGILIEKVAFIEEINRTYKTNFSVMTNNKIILNFLRKKIEDLKKYIDNVKLLMLSITKEGINKITYSFPIFSLKCSSNDYWSQYLTLMGIKYNGSHSKDLENKDAFEIELYELEKQMSLLINDDFTIAWTDMEKFQILFEKYIDTYFNHISEIIHIYDKKEMIIQFMNNYLPVNKLFVRKLNEFQFEEQRINDEHLSKIQEAQIKFNNSNLKEEKNEYLPVSEDNKTSQEKLLLEIILPEELELYNKAKNSGNIEATQIIKDIDALIDLLLDVESILEREELINDLNTYFKYLKETLNISEEVVEKTKIVYYKQFINGIISFRLLEDIKNINKGHYKTIYLQLNKLIKGNINGNREVLGKLPVKVWSTKGIDYHIFYTIMNGIVIVIGCFDSKIGFDEIKKIVNTKDFITFYNEIKLQIENNTWLDEQDYTDLILSELAKSEVVRKRIK